MKNVFFCVLLVLASCVFSLGQTYKVLYNFGGGSDGGSPRGNLIFDAAGNLYGTTPIGGNQSSGGVVFELSPQTDGTWTETVLYDFCSVSHYIGCLDGIGPSSLIFDAEGNLYGTAGGGDKICSNDLTGCGVVFELSPPAGGQGQWTEKVLYNFCSVRGTNHSCLDGKYPSGPVVFDSAGNLYGTTDEGGSSQLSAGTVFELSPSPSGWVETVLYNFCSVGSGTACPDGYAPQGGVALDAYGNLYGTTVFGGPCCDSGLIYKLVPGSQGWQESVLLYFRNLQGLGLSYARVTFDQDGNLYTTASHGGKYINGGVVKIDQTKRSVFACYTQLSPDTAGPMAAVTIDSTRKVLYGTDSGEGGTAAYGSVFQIDSSGVESNLYVFPNNGMYGGFPTGSLVEDSQGNLYGTASGEGLGFQGVVFELTP